PFDRLSSLSRSRRTVFPTLLGASIRTLRPKSNCYQSLADSESRSWHFMDWLLGPRPMDPSTTNLFCNNFVAQQPVDQLADPEPGVAVAPQLRAPHGSATSSPRSAPAGAPPARA